MEPTSAFSVPVSRATALSVPVPAPPPDDLDPPLLLNSLSFSSMDFCGTGAAFGGVSTGGRDSLGGSCFTENMEVVALCLAFRDLLRQGLLEELGWGMAEEQEEVELVLLKVDVLLEVLMGPEGGACSAIPEDWVLIPSGGSFSWVLSG